MLAWLVKERGISPHIPAFDKSWRDDGTFCRADFTYDAERDLYVRIHCGAHPEFMVNS